MRILIASSTYFPAMNGQAVFTTNLAEGLAKRGHTVKVVVDARGGQASNKTVHGVALEELRAIRFNLFKSDVYFSPLPGRQVGRLLNKFQPDIVHIQDHYPICWAAAYRARKRGIKIVGSNHFIPENLAPYIPFYRTLNPIYNWGLWQWMLLVYRLVDAITAQSRAAASLIEKEGLHMPILPISCGIDLLTFQPNPREDRLLYCQRYGLDASKKIFLFLGRIDGEKRVDLLLQAMREIGRDDVQMAIAGRGRAERVVRHLADRLGVAERVKFTGYIPAEDVPGLMNSIDVFVMPSEAELLSISSLEAMACGRPVLLANSLALPELVNDGGNGYLFTPGAVGDLVRLINLMADHPERWPAMGAASRELAMQHSLEDVIRKFENLYAQLLSALPVAETETGLKEIV